MRLYLQLQNRRLCSYVFSYKITPIAKQTQLPVLRLQLQNKRGYMCNCKINAVARAIVSAFACNCFCSFKNTLVRVIVSPFTNGPSCACNCVCSFKTNAFAHCSCICTAKQTLTFQMSVFVVSIAYV